MSSVKTLLIGATLVWASSAWADVLYWLVENEQDPETGFWYATNVDNGGARIQFDEAKVRTSNGAYLAMADEEGKGLTWEGQPIVSVPAEFANVKDNASYVQQDYVSAARLFVELYINGDLVANSEMEMDALRKSGALVSSAAEIAKPWSPTFTANVPEPTSGLLVLMGIVGLGLRRKVEKLKS